MKFVTSVYSITYVFFKSLKFSSYNISTSYNINKYMDTTKTFFYSWLYFYNYTKDRYYSKPGTIFDEASRGTQDAGSGSPMYSYANICGMVGASPRISETVF